MSLCGQPPLLLAKRELRVLLDPTEPLEFLTSGAASVWGKPVCPVPLARHEQALSMIRIQSDMTGGDGGWGAMPLPGPTQDWPIGVLDLLRHIRTVYAEEALKEREDKAAWEHRKADTGGAPDGN